MFEALIDNFYVYKVSKQLNDLYTMFEAVIDNFDVYKVGKTAEWFIYYVRGCDRQFWCVQGQ